MSDTKESSVVTGVRLDQVNTGFTEVAVYIGTQCIAYKIGEEGVTGVHIKTPTGGSTQVHVYKGNFIGTVYNNVSVQMAGSTYVPYGVPSNAKPVLAGIVNGKKFFRVVIPRQVYKEKRDDATCPDFQYESAMPIIEGMPKDHMVSITTTDPAYWGVA